MSKDKTILHDWARMCDTFGDAHCHECPLKRAASPGDCFCFSLYHPDEASAVIRKWVEEHPVKTYKMDFLEKFPNAALKTGWSYMVCKRRIYNGEGCSEKYTKCENCWNEPMEV